MSVKELASDQHYLSQRESIRGNFHFLLGLSVNMTKREDTMWAVEVIKILFYFQQELQGNLRGNLQVREVVMTEWPNTFC